MSGSAVTSKKIPLEVWEKIEIIVERGGQKGLYLTRVEDIHDSCIIVSHPSHTGGSEILASSDIVYVQFKKPDALYRFGARLKFLSDDPTGQVKLNEFSRIERVQRRNFVRIKTKYNIKYRLIKKHNGNEDGDVWYDSISRDFSAGGVLIEVERTVQTNDVLLLRIRDYARMGIPRLICGVCRRAFDSEDEYFAGLEFIINSNLSQFLSDSKLNELPSSVREFTALAQNKLVNYIFEIQVQNRQKGLI